MLLDIVRKIIFVNAIRVANKNATFFSSQREEKKAKAEKEKAKRKDDFARGRMLGVSLKKALGISAPAYCMSWHVLSLQVCGREVFEFNPDMVDDVDSDDEGVVDSYQREAPEEEEEVSYYWFSWLL